MKISFNSAVVCAALSATVLSASAGAETWTAADRHRAEMAKAFRACQNEKYAGIDQKAKAVVLARSAGGRKAMIAKGREVGLKHGNSEALGEKLFDSDSGIMSRYLTAKYDNLPPPPKIAAMLPSLAFAWDGGGLAAFEEMASALGLKPAETADLAEGLAAGEEVLIATLFSRGSRDSIRAICAANSHSVPEKLDADYAALEKKYGEKAVEQATRPANQRQPGR